MRRLLIITLLPLLVSCFQKVAFDTELVIKPVVQTENQAEFIPLEGVVAYAYSADTITWGVRSYEDALSGILYNKKSDEAMLPQVKAQSIDIEGMQYTIAMQIQQERVMLLAVDTQNKCYAFTEYTVGVNLPRTIIALPFRPWKGDKIYKEGTWFYVPSPIVEPDVDDTQN